MHADFRRSGWIGADLMLSYAHGKEKSTDRFAQSIAVNHKGLARVRISDSAAPKHAKAVETL
jgi:hypothetical protein